MSGKKRLGKIIGGVMLVVAVVSVLFFKPKKEAELEDTTVRPIKSMVVGESFQEPNLYFPGLVDSDIKVTLSFNVPGQLMQIPLSDGQTVKKGELLAQLDDSSFQNEVKNAQAEVTRAQATFKRMEQAMKSNAISKEDFSKAKADYDKAMAKLEISKKNLEDTKILARFDGVIAETHVDKFDTLSAGQRVVTLQNNDMVNIVVSIPEQYLINRKNQKRANDQGAFHAIFDALPGEKFPLTIKEYSTQADFKTQTYRVRFQMKTPDKYVILPGMSATVVIQNLFIADKAADSTLMIESDSSGIDSTGGHFVWILEKSDQPDIFKAVQRTIKVGRRSGTTVQVMEGLKTGERIATAGITVLSEGRRVSLLTPKADKERE